MGFFQKYAHAGVFETLHNKFAQKSSQWKLVISYYCRLCNNSGFAFLLLTNGLDLHLSILVETNMRKIVGFIFLHSSRVFEFYPFRNTKAECPVWYISYFLHFGSFIPPVSRGKNRIMSKTVSGIYLVIVFLLYDRSVVWAEGGYVVIVN